jgi:hypothetical protein
LFEIKIHNFFFFFFIVKNIVSSGGERCPSSRELVFRKNSLKEGGEGGERAPPLHYNSMSCASSSEKSDMELSDEESPARSSCSFSASSVAYFWMYSGGEQTRWLSP